MNGYYLITTRHLPKGLWFKDEEDYKVGMNLFAVQASRSPLRIMSFILMSNHVHLVAYGEADDAKLFIDNYKNLYSRYLRYKYSISEFLRRNSVEVQSLTLEEEAPERAIAYSSISIITPASESGTSPREL